MICGIKRIKLIIAFELKEVARDSWAG